MLLVTRRIISLSLKPMFCDMCFKIQGSRSSGVKFRLCVSVLTVLTWKELNIELARQPWRFNKQDPNGWSVTNKVMNQARNNGTHDEKRRAKASIGGVEGARDAPPGQNFFIFTQFSGENWSNRLAANLGLVPHFGKFWMLHWLQWLNPEVK